MKPSSLWKKGDVLILIFALILCAGSFFWTLLPFAPPQQVTITVGGQLYGRYSLSQDQTIEIRQESGAYNRIEIQDGKVYMAQASCPDHVCIRQGALTRAGVIVCLPNQVVIQTDSQEDAGVDAIAG